MYRQTCPNCRAGLGIKDCAPILYRGFGVCKYCLKPFQVKRKTIHLHAAILGAVIGIMGRAILDASFVEGVIYSVLFIVIFQRFIDFFYDLEPADENLVR